jgi:cytosine/adenosine deaminase-related metal-dependent hydrolase
MRKLTANYIFTGKTVLKYGIIEIDDTGKIITVIDTGGQLKETASLEYYNGVLVPGFINAHCHLELSHMKGVINQFTVSGLPGFIDEIISKRSFPENLQETIYKADKEMQMNGIVAVGDISNTDDTFNIKIASPMYYHTFVETFTLDAGSSKQAFGKAVEHLEKLEKAELPGTIVPHASYTVPYALYELIRNYKNDIEKIVSIHNQETASEDEFIISKTGALADVLKKKGFQFTDFSYEDCNSIEYTLKNQDRNNHILLIHNTFTDENHMDIAESFSDHMPSLKFIY